MPQFPFNFTETHTAEERIPAELAALWRANAILSQTMSSVLAAIDSLNGGTPTRETGEARAVVKSLLNSAIAEIGPHQGFSALLELWGRDPFKPTIVAGT